MIIHFHCYIYMSVSHNILKNLYVHTAFWYKWYDALHELKTLELCKKVTLKPLKASEMS